MAIYDENSGLLMYVQVFTKTSYLLFRCPVTEAKYIHSSTLMIFLNQYNLQKFNEKFEKLLFKGNLHVLSASPIKKIKGFLKKIILIICLKESKS